MRKQTIAAVLVAAGISGAGVAHAESITDPSNVADTVTDLQDLGYSVQFNGDLEDALEIPNGLAHCTVNDVSPLVAAPAQGFQVVYVNVDCPMHSGSS